MGFIPILQCCNLALNKIPRLNFKNPQATTWHRRTSLFLFFETAYDPALSVLIEDGYCPAGETIRPPGIAMGSSILHHFRLHLVSPLSFDRQNRDIADQIDRVHQIIGMCK